MPAAGEKIVISDSRIEFFLRISSIPRSKTPKISAFGGIQTQSGPGSSPDNYADPGPGRIQAGHTMTGPKIPKTP